MDKKELKSIIASAFQEANKTAEKNAAFCNGWNPENKKERDYLLTIEKAGINNLYYQIMKEIEKI